MNLTCTVAYLVESCYNKLAVNRERIFMIAFKDECPRTEIFLDWL